MPHESLEMLKSEEGQLNAVFACFGAAAQHAQFFEAALGDFLVVYNKICNENLTVQDFDAVGQNLQKKTMGALLTEFKKYVTISDVKVVELMDFALKKRNFLMHQFFRDRKDKFSIEQGRMEMLVELVSISNSLEQAMKITNGMRVALLEALQKSGDEPKSTDTERNQSQKESKVLFSFDIKVPD
jgi:hypothetical protein